MLPRSLTLEGFKSFRGESELRFPRRPGLYQLVGTNRLEPDLGGNGSGKSTLWDALTWALFGRTARGLHGPAVESWDDGPGGAFVAVRFTGGHEVIRTRRPNALSWDGRTVTQEELEAELGWDREAWFHAVLMGQFAPFFFDLGPAQKLDLFSRVLDLERWTRASKRARAFVVALERDRDQLEVEVREADARVEGSAEIYCRAEEERLVRHHAAGRTVLELRERAEELEACIGGLLEVHETARRSAARVSGRRADAEDELVRLDREERELEKTEAGARAAVAAREREIGRGIASARAGSTCPTCEQPVAAGLWESLRERELERLEREGEDDYRVLADAQRALEGVRRKKSIADEELQRRQAGGVGREETASRAREGLRGAERELEEVCRDLERARAETRSTELVDVLRREHQDALALLEERRTALERVRRDLDGVAYWPDGFRDLRLWVVERALAQLEVEVNAGLVELGLPDWRITLAVERETQAGTVRTGFSVRVESPDSRGEVPWESWSGGEVQRLRIAGAVGFGNLVRAYRGVDVPLEVWDEPTAHLSEDGIDDLLRYFEARARTERRQIWLVDHRSLDAGVFDGTYHVVKDERGSWIPKDARSARPA